MTKITWAALEAAVSRAGLILADDAEVVSVRLIQSTVGTKGAILEPLDGSRHHVLWETNNRTVTVDGSSIFVIADVVGAGMQEMQLNLYKTWVVEDDLELPTTE